MAPFCKKPMDIIMNGITGEEGRDMTVSFLFSPRIEKANW
jgi:hypothetical protein